MHDCNSFGGLDVVIVVVVADDDAVCGPADAMQQGSFSLDQHRRLVWSGKRRIYSVLTSSGHLGNRKYRIIVTCSQVLSKQSLGSSRPWYTQENGCVWFPPSQNPNLRHVWEFFLAKGNSTFCTRYSCPSRSNLFAARVMAGEVRSRAEPHDHDDHQETYDDAGDDEVFIWGG